MKRAVEAARVRSLLWFKRSAPGDLAALIADAKRWRPIVMAHYGTELVNQWDATAAWARFKQGDVENAHADLLRVWQRQASNHAGPTRKIEGIVRDVAGRPVAGVRVLAASTLGGDAVGVIPVADLNNTLRIATSDSAGRFRIDDATLVGVVAAELADRRSLPVAIADHVRIVLEPTRRISGHVDLAKIDHERAQMFCIPSGIVTGAFMLIAPVASDGAFSFSGASSGAVRIGVLTLAGWNTDHIELATLPASAEDIHGIQLSLTKLQRQIDIIVRNSIDAPLESARVFLRAGKHPIDRLKSLNDLVWLRGARRRSRFAAPPIGEDLSKAVVDKLRRGDVLAQFEHAPAGELTVCAIALGTDSAWSGGQRQLRDHADQFVIKCEHVSGDASVVVVSVPPQPRMN